MSPADVLRHRALQLREQIRMDMAQCDECQAEVSKLMEVIARQSAEALALESAAEKLEDAA